MELFVERQNTKVGHRILLWSIRRSEASSQRHVQREVSQKTETGFWRDWRHNSSVDAAGLTVQH